MITIADIVTEGIIVLELGLSLCLQGGHELGQELGPVEGGHADRDAGLTGPVPGTATAQFDHSRAVGRALGHALKRIAPV